MEVNNKSPINDIANWKSERKKSLEVLPGHLLHQLLRFLLRFPRSTPHLEACGDFSANVKHSLKKTGDFIGIGFIGTGRRGCHQNDLINFSVRIIADINNSCKTNRCPQTCVFKSPNLSSSVATSLQVIQPQMM